MVIGQLVLLRPLCSNDISPLVARMNDLSALAMNTPRYIKVDSRGERIEAPIRRTERIPTIDFDFKSSSSMAASWDALVFSA